MCKHLKTVVPVWVSMVFGPEDGEQEAEEKHHQAKTN